MKAAKVKTQVKIYNVVLRGLECCFKTGATMQWHKTGSSKDFLKMVDVVPVEISSSSKLLNLFP